MILRFEPSNYFIGLFLFFTATGDAAYAASEAKHSKESFRRPVEIPYPINNPITSEKIALGKTLFFDARLSRNSKTSCSTCHAPEKRWSDGLRRPIGTDGIANIRRTPSILNSAWLTTLMWDGRSPTLETQASLPITTPHEMNFGMESLVNRLSEIQGYRKLFFEAYGSAEISPNMVTEAIASFERTLVSKQSPFDLWVNGKDDAISDSAKRGFTLFVGKAKCVSCHMSWRLTDDSFHDIGLETEDLGRGNLAPKQIILMQHAFKTPSLRDLSIDGPYMHDGSFNNLEQVIKHYEKGGINRKSRSLEIKSFELNDEERLSLIELIKTFDGGPLEIEPPALPK